MTKELAIQVFKNNMEESVLKNSPPVLKEGLVTAFASGYECGSHDLASALLNLPAHQAVEFFNSKLMDLYNTQTEELNKLKTKMVMEKAMRK